MSDGAHGGAADASDSAAAGGGGGGELELEGGTHCTSNDGGLADGDGDDGAAAAAAARLAHGTDAAPNAAANAEPEGQFDQFDICVVTPRAGAWARLEKGGGGAHDDDDYDDDDDDGGGGDDDGGGGDDDHDPRLSATEQIVSHMAAMALSDRGDEGRHRVGAQAAAREADAESTADGRLLPTSEAELMPYLKRLALTREVERALHHTASAGRSSSVRAAGQTAQELGLGFNAVDEYAAEVKALTEMMAAAKEADQTPVVAVQ